MNAAVLLLWGNRLVSNRFLTQSVGREAIVQVRAAALKPIDKQIASGSHQLTSF
jgi:hypothetical protein